MRGAVRQEWALVGRDPRHVSEFAGLAPKDRPAGTCLECKRPVIFKCGGVRSHHVAHRAANEECEAASGEGAEHYNAKLYLASVLRQASGFEAFDQCVRCGVLNGSKRLKFTYDRVELEHSHPNRLRADIALFSADQLACVIEIYVSHRCGCEKIAFHKEAGIPCLEVSAEYAQRWHPRRRSRRPSFTASTVGCARHAAIGRRASPSSAPSGIRPRRWSLNSPRPSHGEI